MIAARTVSSREVLASCLQRINETNPHLNAVVEMDREGAERRAAEADEATARGQACGLLHGLPTLIKESSDIAGFHTTQGSPMYRDRIAARDDSMTASVRAEGAVILGKTNVPELLHGLTTNNSLYGLTRNPFDPDISCQGSSGGAAVALSVSMTPISTGSDTGGSIRGPAATNGVLGLRPSPGLIGREDTGHVFNPSGVLGPLARNAGDLALTLAAMAHVNRRDPFFWSMDKAALERPQRVELSALRVAISPDLGGVVEIDDAIRHTFLAKLDRFASRFGSVSMTEPDLGQIFKAFWLLRPLKFMASMGAHYKERPDAFTEYKRLDMRRGFASSSEQIVWAMAEQTRSYRAMVDFFESYDVLIMPGWATGPLTLDEIARREAAMAKANAAAGPFAFDFSNPDPIRSINPPITLTHHPVLTMPAGLGPTGHPFAFNIVGPVRQDGALLGLAAALEEVFEADTDLARPLPDVAAVKARATERAS
jgi:Asp-tRNA(Asn)/Glu-tRNA(Gln) amidotransferase A subunit family amidase